MGNLYLIYRNLGHEDLALPLEDREAQVALLQDAVYIEPGLFTKEGTQVYALKWDADHRGVSHFLPPSVRLISYHELVDLIVANKVINLT